MKLFLAILLTLIGFATGAAIAIVYGIYPRTSPFRDAPFAVEQPSESDEKSEKTVGDSDKGKSRDGEEVPVSVPEMPQKPRLIDIAVPFVVQAPFGKWSEPRFQDGCEEASLIMAHLWLSGRSMSLAEQEAELRKLSAYQEKTRGYYQDTSAEDTAVLMREYYKHDRLSVKKDIDVQDIIDALGEGAIVIVPLNGRILKNPNYTPPGPERHMLVVRGYDPATHEFITNDPGTRKGEGYRYAAALLERALHNYESGIHRPLGKRTTAMIEVYRK